ncbi:hypothetical protein [uncultured Shewanella sp.]|uniref:hypothetical protein n=1 Tax=uncultured Shewanella sp. TaxID=173975 RepID=UPI0026095C11|nr:hypothetical protein [uncultured Shewanella sp.]
MKNVNRSHKITMIVFIFLCHSQSQARYVETITPLIQDELGEKSLIDMRDQLNRIQAQYAELAKAINEREGIIANEVKRFEELIEARTQAINSIKREDSYRFYTVRPNSFRLELTLFAKRIGIKTIRWSSDIKECIDWRFDSTFQIDISNREDAINEFFDGLPLMAKLHLKDQSLNITATEIMNDCF